MLGNVVFVMLVALWILAFALKGSAVGYSELGGVWGLAPTFTYHSRYFYEI